MTMDKMELNSLKRSLRNVSREAESLLISRSAQAVTDDTPVFDRSERKHRSLAREMRDEIRSWEDDD